MARGLWLVFLACPSIGPLSAAHAEKLIRVESLQPASEPAQAAGSKHARRSIKSRRFVGEAANLDAALTEADPGVGSASVADEVSEAPSNPASSRGWVFSGGIWPGADTFAGVANVGYMLNPYVGTGLFGHYTHRSYDDIQAEQYGGHVDLVLKLPNPTPVTPYCGAGPGYEKWRRAEDELVFADGASVIAMAYGGIQVELTRHFGIQAQRQQKIFVQEPPKSFADHAQVEPERSISNHIGFVVMF